MPERSLDELAAFLREFGAGHVRPPPASALRSIKLPSPSYFSPPAPSPPRRAPHAGP